MDLSKLTEPFPNADIEWRIGRAGKNDKGIWAMCLAYITNRAIMERLDEVCGPGNWRNEYREAPAGGVLCGLSIRIGDEWVTKWDGAENTNMEAVKGGLSGAMKRAAVQWGIGRYLYHLPEGWASVHKGGANYGKLPEKYGGDSFRWDPPGLPEWALPSGTGKPDGEVQANRQTGEIEDEEPSPKPQPKATPKSDDDMIACPECSGPMWNNRGDTKASINGGKRPDLKCKDKEGCDHAIWLKSWRDDLKSKLADAHNAQVIDVGQRDRGEEAADSLSPKRMLALDEWVDTQVSKAVLGGAPA